jgi:hypothetical protein
VEVILRVDIDIATADAYFLYAGYKIRDAREPLRDVMHEVVWPAIRGQLDEKGARSGAPWQELSEEYGAWKELRYPGEPILRLTGAMERSLFDPFSYRVTMQNLTYRPLDEKVSWHQTGAERSRGGRLPQRVIVELTVEDYETVDDIFTEWLDELRTANARRGPLGTPPGAPSIDILGI